MSDYVKTESKAKTLSSKIEELQRELRGPCKGGFLSEVYGVQLGIADRLTPLLELAKEMERAYAEEKHEHTPVGTRIFVHDRNNPSKGWTCVMGEDGTYIPLDYIDAPDSTLSTSGDGREHEPNNR